MGVVLQIIADLLLGYGVNPGVVQGLFIVVYISVLINMVYIVFTAPSKVIEIFNWCKGSFTKLKFQCKKPPKSVGAEVDGSNNSLN